jgi:PAS domain S-box-containing protein
VADLEALGDHDRFFRKLGRHTVCGVYVYDLDTGQNVYVNPRYTQLLGYTLRELNELDSEAFLGLFHPEDRGAIFAHMGEVGAAGEDVVLPIRYRFRHKNGSWVWCLSYDVAFERHPDGRMRRFIGSFVDVSQVVGAQESQAHFAQMAAHDLRAPARRVSQFAELLELEAGDDLDEAARELLAAIRDQARSMHELIDAVRELTRLSMPLDGKASPCALDPLLDRVLENLRQPLEAAGAQVRRDPLPTVSGHPALIATLYTNLITNALRYGGAGVQIEITTDADAGEHVFGVRNTGSTILPEHHDSVFTPFRRYSAVGEGAGLGLSICQRVVERHGGRIWVESGPSDTHLRFTLGPCA